MKIKDTNVYWDFYSELKIPIFDTNTRNDLEEFINEFDNTQTFYAAFDMNNTLFIYSQLPEYREERREWDVIMSKAKYPKRKVLIHVGNASIQWCWRGESGSTLHTVTRQQLCDFIESIRT